MNKLNLNIDEEISLIEKYELTPNELFLIRAIFLAKEGYTENYIMRFIKASKLSLRNLLESLQNKGVINKNYIIPKSGEIFDPYIIPINKIIATNFHKAAFDLGEELFDNYPMFGNINGITVSLRGFAKKFDSIEDFFRFYGKTIKWDPNKHQEILDLITWAKDNTKYLNMSIATFVIEHKWEELKALKAGDIVNINYDTVTLL